MEDLPWAVFFTTAESAGFASDPQRRVRWGSAGQSSATRFRFAFAAVVSVRTDVRTVQCRTQDDGTGAVLESVRCAVKCRPCVGGRPRS